MRIGIVGGSVAGAFAAHLLARQGHKVTVYERRPDRETPCGGGISEKAFLVCPEIVDLPAPYRTIRSMTVITSRGTEASTPVKRTFRIFSRRVLDSALRDMAAESGARILTKHVASIQLKGGNWVLNDNEEYDFLIGAGGYSDPVARHFGRNFDLENTAAMVGYFVPGDFGDRVIIRLLGHVTGYIWVFPRKDHASIGLMVGARGMNRPWAYVVLDRFIARYFPEADMAGARRYGRPAPMVMDPELFELAPCGENWALIGDAAGLCDPLTGEGIHYALISAKYLAQSIEQSDVLSYAEKLKKNVHQELNKAARLRRKFFRGWLWEAAIFLMKRSPTCAAVAADFIAGSQDYRSLRSVTMELLPKILAEALLGSKSG